MQWQVKIAGHLGEDQQFLVLVSSAPSKAKVTSGPTRLHVQDSRLCLTTGVPPKLAGLWEIANLRRYGVVDGKFCFEGGSLCGKGEGLFILLTDQGNEIAQALKNAAQRKLATRRRTTISRKLAGLEISLKTSTSEHRNGCTDASDSGSSSYWPSQEFQSTPNITQLHQQHDLDYNSCGDTVSVSGIPECGEMHNEFWACGDQSINSIISRNISLERCSSCISKLGAISRSSTLTTSDEATPGSDTSFSPELSLQHLQINHQQHLLIQQNPGDRTSICSHGSSSSNSEYSAPRRANSGCKQFGNDTSSSWYEKIPVLSSLPGASSIPKLCHCSCQPPSRPPKPSQISQIIYNTKKDNLLIRKSKPPMPLPIARLQNLSTKNNDSFSRQSVNNLKVGPYENYDTPKIPYLPVESKTSNEKDSDSLRMMIENEYYDTPKRLKQSLIASGNSCQIPDQFGNYDTPTSLMMAGEYLLQIASINNKCKEEIMQRNRISKCPCHRMMTWADNWIPMNYCRRGYGAENTTINYYLQANSDDQMPVVSQPCTDSAIYATVDKSKKNNRQNTLYCACSSSNKKKDFVSNYENIVPIYISSNNTKKIGASQITNNDNYANVEFAESLVNYENANVVLKKTEIALEELQCKEFCDKCGHAKEDMNLSTAVDKEEQESTSYRITSDDYLMMKPNKKIAYEKKIGIFPGYIPMSPVQVFTATADLLEQRVCQLISREKSASNPSLIADSSIAYQNRMRAKSEMRVRGSTIEFHQNYSHRQFRDSDDFSITKSVAAVQLARKRSSSVDSSRYLEKVDKIRENNLSFNSPLSRTLRKSFIHSIIPYEEGDEQRSSSLCLLDYQIRSSCPYTNKSSDETVDIRRSSSVPCKSSQNRDSSSSNDSGVSTGSLKQQEYELEIASPPNMVGKRRCQFESVRQEAAFKGKSVGSKITRSNSNQILQRSKSSDHLNERDPQIETKQTKILLAESEISIRAIKKIKSCANGRDCSALGPPYTDSRSTSSGTSDMSDYFETLSLSSHSSSDTPESLRMQPTEQFGHQATTTLRPRSGKEYQNIDRAALMSSSTIAGPFLEITPVHENPRESSSPGYINGSSPVISTPITETSANNFYKI